MTYLKYLIIFSFLVTLDLQASTKSIKKLRDKISNESTRINKLAAQIQDIDSKISFNNDSYVQRMKDLEKLEHKVENLKFDLKKSADYISEEYIDTKKAFNLYILESTDEEAEDSLLSKNLYLDLLKKKMNELNKAQKNSKSFLKQIQNYEQSISAKKAEEETLYKLIVDLENSKKSMSQKYISLMEDKNRNQSKLNKLAAKRRAVKKVYKKKKKDGTLFKVGLPLENFINASKSKEGITFKFSETTPIKAPRAGRIVYAGQLASYGNVLIIDHGQDVRSVLLGDIVAKVKKGDRVTNSQIIGYTVADLGNVKALYFEVRKKDVVQNTVNWVSTNKKIKL